MEIAAVSLEVYNSARLEEITVARHEKRSRKALLLAPYLRISKGDPDLGDLSGSKKGLDELDTGTEKSHIGKAVFLSVLGAFPKAGALDVYSDIIARWVSLGKVDCIISFSATKLKYYRFVVAEEVTPPIAFHRVVTAKHFRRSRLYHAPESLILPEFP